MMYFKVEHTKEEILMIDITQTVNVTYKRNKFGWDVVPPKQIVTLSYLESTDLEKMYQAFLLKKKEMNELQF